MRKSSSRRGVATRVATSKRLGTIRILEQVKLFAPHRVVDADDVAAFHSVLTLDQRASKGIITTSSRFAPGVASRFADLIPSRLMLVDGQELRERLIRIEKG